VEKLYKQGERIEQNVKIGDIIEITEGVFLRVKKISQITEEDLAGTKKLNVYLKGEIISNGKHKGITKQQSRSNSSI
jgi:hypothetical protein